jgi:hypothetical protein
LSPIFFSLSCLSFSSLSPLPADEKRQKDNKSEAAPVEGKKGKGKGKK